MNPILSASEVFADKPKFDANLVAMRAVLRFVHMDESELAEKLIRAAKTELSYCQYPKCPPKATAIVAEVWKLDLTVCNPKPILLRLADFAITLVSSL